MRKNLLSILLLISVCFLFYIYLFLPEPSLFFTPDLGRSDIIHYNLAKRTLLGQALKDHRLPLWTDRIGTGVSLIGEGQIATYNMINLLLFYLFPTILAFNLAYVFYSALAAVGIFVLARYLGFSRFTAIFTAFVFISSGFFIFRITHINLFAASAFLPFIFLFALRLLDSKRLVDVLFLAFFVAQQIFTGHFQLVFISLVGLFLTILFLTVSDITKKLTEYLTGSFLVFLTIVFGLLLAGVQILPQIEMLGVSVRQGGLSFNEATANSVTPKLLLTLIYPFLFGTPADASYPLYRETWDIFWEKMGYLGVIPLFFALIGILSKNQNFVKYRRAFIMLTAAGILLALGRYSPTFFLYFLPPFNFFRNPARFLLLVDFSLSILAGFGLEQVLRNQKSVFNFIDPVVLKTCLLLSVFIPAFLITTSYHPVVLAEQILTKPESALFLEEKPGRVYQLGGGWPYLQTLLKTGWQDTSYYLFALNSLDADINVLYDIEQVNIYDGVLTKRQEMMQSLLMNEAQGDLAQMTAASTPFHKKLLALTSTNFLISPFKIDDANLPLVKTIASPNPNWPPFYIYENQQALPRIRLVSQYQKAADYNQAEEIMRSDDFDPKTQIVLEGEIDKQFLPTTLNQVKLIEDQPEKILIKAETGNEGILVLADSYYPGWQALIDNQLTKIFPANINQKAIVVPAGKHQVKFLYTPNSFKLGLLISAGSFVVWLILLFVSLRPKPIIK